MRLRAEIFRFLHSDSIRNRDSIKQFSSVNYFRNSQLSQCQKKSKFFLLFQDTCTLPENNYPRDSLVFCKSKLKMFSKLCCFNAIYYRLLNGTETSFNAEANLQPFKCNIDFGKFSLIHRLYCGSVWVFAVWRTFFLIETKHLFVIRFYNVYDFYAYDSMTCTNVILCIISYY